MKRFLTLFLLAASMAVAAEPAAKPRLVVVIVVDQFRYDYLTRYRAEYKDGLSRLLAEGAVFTDAHLEHFPTVTAIGHSVILTGAMPSVTGIVGNDWFDRSLGRHVASVFDDSVKPLGGGSAGASPRRMLASTVGDELKAATGGRARVIGISIKDRAAILPSGHAADAAYWYDSRSGNFVSSTFYFPDLPDWVKEFNRTSLEKYKGAQWQGGRIPADQKASSAIVASPFGNDLLESFAERAIQAEGLGKDDVPDLISISFSSNDYVGHAYGPQAAEVHAICLETDEVIGRMFGFLDASVGMNNVLVVLTADHGVASLPVEDPASRTPGGHMPARIVQNTVQSALAKEYGDGEWIVSSSEHSLYLNQDLVRRKKLSRKEVEETVRETVLSIPHVLRAYTRDQLIHGGVGGDAIGQCVLNGFHPLRGADVFLLLEPGWMFGSSGTTHGTAFNYDTHVPVIFMGPGIRAGTHDNSIAVNDIAHTLSTILEVELPNGSQGRVLSEILIRDAK